MRGKQIESGAGKCKTLGYEPKVKGELEMDLVVNPIPSHIRVYVCVCISGENL